MRTIVRAVAVAALVCLEAGATDVVFSTWSYTGGASTKKITVAVDPRYNPQTDGTNIIGGQPLTLTPDGTGMARTNLVAGDYLVTVDGIPKTWRISVPETNAVLFAAALQSVLPTYSYTNMAPTGSFTVSTNGTAAGTVATARMLTVATNGTTAGTVSL